MRWFHHALRNPKSFLLLRRVRTGVLDILAFFAVPNVFLEMFPIALLG
jgi:hypothetical protein